MKNTLKILTFLFIITIIMFSCTTNIGNEPYKPHPSFPNDDLEKLHHIHPSKPIKVPDTMAIIKNPPISKITIETISQDSIVNK